MTLSLSPTILAAGVIPCYTCSQCTYEITQYEWIRRKPFNVVRSYSRPCTSIGLDRRVYTMATYAPLNPEPSLPEEREANHLPQKSYLDAAEENLHTDPKTEQTAPTQYIGQGEDDAPRSPAKKVHKKSSSLRMNGKSKEKEGSRVIIERFQDKDGEHLTSVKLPYDHEKRKHISHHGRQPSELVSGRKAGKGWERSQYAHSPPSSPPSPLTPLPSQYPLRAPLRTLPTPPPDPRCSRPYPLHRAPPHNLLLPLRSPHHLASPRPVPPLRPLLPSPLLGPTLPPLPIPPLAPNLVLIRNLLPRPPISLRPSPPHPQIHLRLPPPRHNLARRLRRIRHRSSRLLPALPRHHQHPPNPRRQLPRPPLP